MADHPVRASVPELKAPPLEAWYPYALAGFRLEIERPANAGGDFVSGTGIGVRRLLSSTSRTGASARPAPVIHFASSTQSDPTGDVGAAVLVAALTGYESRDHVLEPVIPS